MIVLKYNILLLLTSLKRIDLLLTEWFCKQLNELNIEYFRDPYINILTLKFQCIPEELAHKFRLVPDTHDRQNSWYIVIMIDHVEIDDLLKFIMELEKLSIKTLKV